VTSVDTATVLGQVQALASTLGGLGTALEQAAPTGGFAAVLSSVQADLAALDGGGTASTASASASLMSPFVSTASLLGTGTQADVALGSTGGLSGSQVVTEAEQFLGVPYQWGGTSPTTGFDCSGFVQYVYGQLGVSLPRTSEEQATVGTPVPSLADAQPGDLVFYEPGPSGPGHVGIYIGNGEMIDAPHTGTDVQVQPVGQPSEIRRVLPSATTAAASGSIPASLGVPASLAPLFEQVAASSGVPASLLAAVAKQESGFDPQAVSSAGAEGLMQLMPSTAAGLGVDPFDPQQAVAGAAQLLGSYLQQYNGSVPLALAAYNAGPGAVAQYGGIPPYAQTQQYVADIMASLGASS
jgi:cell wall-associated NlpC family hydrolase